MSPQHNLDPYDFFDDLADIRGPRPRVKNTLKENKRPRRKDRFNIIEEPEVAAAVHAQADDRRTLNFTYQASRTEALWLLDSLGGLFEHRWFDDVLQIVKGGKEASVYQCKGNDTTGAELLAAKVYRPRMFRALRNDAMYRAGRVMLDEDGLVIRREGELKAIHNRSNLGNKLIHQSWIMHEVLAMQKLHAAGFDVPAVYANGDNAILMDYVGDAAMAAPTLHAVRLPAQEAQELFERTLHNIEGMLAMDIIHGDLSAFNILYWEGKISIIDFPQVVNPGGNRSAYEIFRRDVQRICEYFRRQGVPSEPDQLAQKLWRGRGMRTTPQPDPVHLDPESEEDLGYWEQYR